MKVEDLMTGDWVYLFGVPYRIKDIVDDGVINYEKDVTPIPLTEEILHKNGFEYYHSNCAALSSEDKFGINQVQWPDEDGIAVWEYGIIQIRFVHEFQHLLKLCGIEKEIVL